MAKQTLKSDRHPGPSKGTNQLRDLLDLRGCKRCPMICWTWLEIARVPELPWILPDFSLFCPVSSKMHNYPKLGKKIFYNHDHFWKRQRSFRKKLSTLLNLLEGSTFFLLDVFLGRDRYPIPSHPLIPPASWAYVAFLHWGWRWDVETA